ncbi:hypothetical protein, partial [Sphingobium baderi]|uniref:hypothetical protein n=1 Tax=Sphingobium baderi TaxID=1332080 RepID=UPI001F19F284
CPRLKVSTERIIFIDDRDVAIELIGGDDRELRADADNHGCDHEGSGEAERVEAGDLDVGEHIEAPCKPAGSSPLDWRPMCSAGGRDHFLPQAKKP